jgi:hypothetical protein
LRLELTAGALFRFETVDADLGLVDTETVVCRGLGVDIDSFCPFEEFGVRIQLSDTDEVIDLIACCLNLIEGARSLRLSPRLLESVRVLPNEAPGLLQDPLNWAFRQVVNKATFR